MVVHSAGPGPWDKFKATISRFIMSVNLWTDMEDVRRRSLSYGTLVGRCLNGFLGLILWKPLRHDEWPTKKRKPKKHKDNIKTIPRTNKQNRFMTTLENELLKRLRFAGHKKVQAKQKEDLKRIRNLPSISDFRKAVEAGYLDLMVIHSKFANPGSIKKCAMK